MKRLLDIVVSAAVLILASPLIGLLALAIRHNMGSPVLFRQERPGLGGVPFEMIKFRTMRNAHDTSGKLLEDGERLTGLGRFLRASSLDELPELWNVLKGDMSLVGPRPLLMSYLPLYSPRQARRHAVKPGVTGWAQVNGRNALSWDEKFEHDVWYVEHQSFLLDLKILWRTFSAVFGRRGISSDGHATMPYFVGQKKSDSGQDKSTS